MTRTDTRLDQSRGMDFRMALAALAGAVLLLFAAIQSQAQTYRVIHAFTFSDGAFPEAGLTIDAHGNLYGTTAAGGAHECGTVFKMTPHGSNWTLAPLYAFTDGADGCQPATRVVFGPNGTLYGTTSFDTVYNLRPPPTRPASVLQGWNETTLYGFQDSLPAGDVIFDSSGNLYGAMSIGGSGCYNGCGFIYELSPSGGGWNLTVLYNFSVSDGVTPEGIVFDRSGNIFGTTNGGGAEGWGTIFELMPSSQGWIESVLYNFESPDNGGSAPGDGLVEDGAGNFYGSTSYGPNGTSVAFELSPANGSWTYTPLYDLPGVPSAPLTLDAAGNLYGTIYDAAQYPNGVVFKLSPSANGWTFTALHEFTGGTDGKYPASNVSIDANGNLFGTAEYGGEGCETNGCGVVWEITP